MNKLTGAFQKFFTSLTTNSYQTSTIILWFVSTLLLINRVETEGSEGDKLVFAIFFVCTAIAFFAVALIGMDTQKVAIWGGLSVLVSIVIGLYLYITSFYRAATMYDGISLIFMFLIIFFASFLLARVVGRTRDFWVYVVQYLLQMLLLGTFAIILYVGLAGALASLNWLFAIEIDSVVYEVVAAVVFTLGIPLLFVSRISESINNTNYPKYLLIFNKFIVAPLVSIYTAIIVLYAFKIIFTGEVPENQIGGLMSVLYLGIVYLIISLLPIRNRGGKKAIYFSYIITAIGILLFPLYLYSIGVRVISYGLTIDRGIALAAGVIFLLAMIYSLVPRPRISVYLVLPIIILGITLYFPLINIFSLSESHQVSLLNKLLENHGILKADGTIQKQDLSYEESSPIRQNIQYLLQNHGIDQLPYLVKEVDYGLNDFGFVSENYSPYELESSIMNVLSNVTAQEATSRYYSIMIDYKNNASTDLENVKSLETLMYSKYNTTNKVTLTKTTMSLYVGNELYEIDLAQYLNSFLNNDLAQDYYKGYQYEPSKMILDTQFGKILFTNIQIYAKQNKGNWSVDSIESFEGFILIN